MADIERLLSIDFESSVMDLTIDTAVSPDRTRLAILTDRGEVLIYRLDAQDHATFTSRLAFPTLHPAAMSRPDVGQQSGMEGITFMDNMHLIGSGRVTGAQMLNLTTGQIE
jgi:hypothetical protein